MDQRNSTIIIKTCFEFAVVSFAVFALAELVKPHSVTAFLRLDYYFLVMLLVGGFYLYFSAESR